MSHQTTCENETDSDLCLLLQKTVRAYLTYSIKSLKPITKEKAGLQIPDLSPASSFRLNISINSAFLYGFPAAVNRSNLRDTADQTKTRIRLSDLNSADQTNSFKN